MRTFSDELSFVKTRLGSGDVAADDARIAADLDARDELASFRSKFILPPRNAKDASSGDSIYLCGNSLGPQPKRTRELVQEDLDVWARYGVEGHFHEDVTRPWVAIDETVQAKMARVLGAKEHEVVVMNTLSVNIHLMMVHFYQPKAQGRFKVIIEGRAFPSDFFAVSSQIQMHGMDPAEALVELNPREGEVTLRTEDILAAIADAGDELALVMLSGVQYLTGQAFEMERITAAGHQAGAYVGWDLAHASGNLELHMHDWDADFAVFCSYKYLNSGPGSLGGVFLHEKHAQRFDKPRLAGWWGSEKETRFAMDNVWRPMAGPQGFQLSNPPVLSMAAILAALEVHDEAGMARIRAKSVLLTGYLEFLLDNLCKDSVVIATPRDPAHRGAQLSLRFTSKPAKDIHKYIQDKGVICDLREPDTMRIAPAPLFNSFADVLEFVQLLCAANKEV